MRKFIKNSPKEGTLLFVCIAVFVIMTILTPSKFISPNNFSSMMTQIPELGIFSLAMMMVILTGGINLSITYLATLSGIAGAMSLSYFTASGMPGALAILLSMIIGLAVACAAGLLNGFLVAHFHVSPILATLGTQMLFQGVGLNLTQGASITGFPAGFEQLGNGTIGGLIPFTFIIFIAMIIISWVILERTPWGLKVHMIGNNETAMNYSGVNVKKMYLQLYLLSAIFSYLAAVLMMSRYNSMKSDYGSSYMMQAVLATVMGGTSIAGGYGKVAGTLIAIITIQFISSGLNIFGLNRFVVDVVMGAMLIGVLIVHFIVDTTATRKMMKQLQSEAAAEAE